MKTIYKFSLLLLTIIALASCETAYELSIKVDKKAVLADKVVVSLVEENNNPIEEVTFFVNGREVSSSNNSFTLDTKEYGTGKHLISAMVAYGENKSKRINNSIEVFSNIPFTSYDFKIVNVFPHDGTAYTQGLEYYNGFLYETTGKLGKSSLRKVELKTGKVIQKIDLDRRYFGEGMTIFDNKIFFLTWKANKGFVYNLESFELESEFPYNRSKEGWGLTHSDTELIKSDGTSKIWFLDPSTQKEKRYIEAYTNQQSLDQLNELEYINGKIYANYWQKPLIAIINPENGIVEGLINLTRLVQEMEKSQKLLKENPKLMGLENAIITDKWKTVALTRVSLIIPYGLLNYAFGATEIKLKHYLIGNLAMIVPSIMYVWWGSQTRIIAGAIETKEKGPSYTISLIISFLLTIWLVIRSHKISKNLAYSKMNRGPEMGID